MTRFHALLVFLLVGPLYFNDPLIAQPQVIRVKPEAGSTGVPLYVPGLIEIEFDQPMNRTSVINAIETETDPPLPPFVQALRVSVNNAPPRTRQQAYVSVTAEESTGIALHNPHKTESATVDLVLVRSLRRTEVKLHWQVGMRKGRNPLMPR